MPAVRSLQSKTYERFLNRLAQISRLHSLGDVAQWDKLLHLPPKATRARSQQMAALAGTLHDLKTDRRLMNMAYRVLRQAKSEGDTAAERNAELFLRDVERERRIPRDLVAALAAARSSCQQIWEKKARPTGDFTQVRGALAEVVKLSRERAAAIDDQQTPYAVALEDYEPGLTASAVEKPFAELRRGLAPLIEQWSSAGVSKPRRGGYDDIGHDWPVRRLHGFILDEIIRPMGFDFDAGRVDWSTTTHPCCSTIHPEDVRLITRYDEQTSLAKALRPMTHEAGHGLYEQGRPVDLTDQPIGQYASMAAHESQSRFWECRVIAGRAFLGHLADRLVERGFASRGKASVIAEHLYRALHRVQPGFIRIHADEVTYPLHIILRFELEQALMNGALEVADLAEAFNHKMQAYLGLKVSNQAQGVLQDTQWFSGKFGYFPTYLMGSMYAAQIYQAALREIAGLELMIARGEFSVLREWLRQKIHLQGHRYDTVDLMHRVTGSHLSARPLLAALKDEYALPGR